jgi:hypothetical protein
MVKCSCALINICNRAPSRGYTHTHCNTAGDILECGLCVVYSAFHLRCRCCTVTVRKIHARPKTHKHRDQCLWVINSSGNHTAMSLCACSWCELRTWWSPRRWSGTSPSTVMHGGWRCSRRLASVDQHPAHLRGFSRRLGLHRRGRPQ